MPILAEVLAVVLAHAIGAWLITYLLHSAVLHALASVLGRVCSDAALHVVAWRTALIAPLFTASLHTALPFGSPFRMSVEPASDVLGARPSLAVVIIGVWYALILARTISVIGAERRARSALGERHRCTDAGLLDMLASQASVAGATCAEAHDVAQHLFAGCARDR
jgi:hypothetical protein